MLSIDRSEPARQGISLVRHLRLPLAKITAMGPIWMVRKTTLKMHQELDVSIKNP
jgi:hypothetical protein